MPATQAGPALQEKQVSRGLAVGDLFNDGNMDVVIEESRRPARCSCAITAFQDVIG